MKVGDWIKRYPGQAITVAPDSSLEMIIDRLLAEPCLRDIYVLSEEGRVLGHLSHKKITRLFLAEHQSTHTRSQLMERIAGGHAQELMDSHFIYAHPDEELDNVLQRQLEHDVEDMLVVDENGIVLGAVNLTAVLKHIRKKG